MRRRGGAAGAAIRRSRRGAGGINIVHTMGSPSAGALALLDDDDGLEIISGPEIFSGSFFFWLNDDDDDDDGDDGDGLENNFGPSARTFFLAIFVFLASGADVVLLEQFRTF